MKKCKGCGEILQYASPDEVGYAPNDTFEYCQRCFRLSHYGDHQKVVISLKDNDKVLNSLKALNNCLFVYIVDCFEALIIEEDKLLKQFIDKDLLIIINKIDLLPRNIKDDKMNDLYRKSLNALNRDHNIKCLLTYKNDQTFNDLFFELLKEYNYNKIVFFGHANVGKSSLINKLIGEQGLTTSPYPGTTTNLNQINFHNYTFIDSPGILDDESFLSYLDSKYLKELISLKTIKAQSFQLYSDQAYFVEGLVEADIKPRKQASVIFFINNNLNVHRTKLTNAETYSANNLTTKRLKLLPFNKQEYKIDKYKTFYLKGLGIFKIKGNCEVDIKVNDKIKIYVNEVNI